MYVNATFSSNYGSKEAGMGRAGGWGGGEVTAKNGNIR